MEATEEPSTIHPRKLSTPMITVIIIDLFLIVKKSILQ